jgi:hypothetical protein
VLNDKPQDFVEYLPISRSGRVTGTDEAAGGAHDEREEEEDDSGEGSDSESDSDDDQEQEPAAGDDDEMMADPDALQESLDKEIWAAEGEYTAEDEQAMATAIRRNEQIKDGKCAPNPPTVGFGTILTDSEQRVRRLVWHGTSHTWSCHPPAPRASGRRSSAAASRA